MYNNKKITLSIRQYAFEHKQNLDKVLADLEQASITIARAKSQFWQAGFMIVDYICDAASCHPDTSKISKILN